jgi:hypothetical protein
MFLNIYFIARSQGPAGWISGYVIQLKLHGQTGLFLVQFDFGNSRIRADLAKDLADLAIQLQWSIKKAGLNPALFL